MVASNVTEVNFRQEPVVGVVTEALTVEESRSRERPVAGNVTVALAREVEFKEPVVGNVTEALMHDVRTGDQQENSYQETVPKEYPVTTTTTEVLECDRGPRDYVALEQSTAHVEKDMAGANRKIPIKKSRQAKVGMKYHRHGLRNSNQWQPTNFPSTVHLTIQTMK